MTTIEKIRNYGGFIDFGASGSMPWGIFPNGNIASSNEYYEAMQLRAQNPKFQVVKLVSAKKFKHSSWLVAKRYKVFGITVYKKYHKGVLYQFSGYKSSDIGKRAIAYDQRKAGFIVNVWPHPDSNLHKHDYVKIDNGMTLHRHYFFIEGENNNSISGKQFEEHKHEFFKD